MTNPSLHVRVPDDVNQWLRDRAARNRRSIQGEVVTILETQMLRDVSDQGFETLKKAAAGAE